MRRRSVSGDVALKACKEFPDTPSRTLARMLRTQHPKLFASIEIARSAIRAFRGNMGEQARQGVPDHGVRRANRTAGEVLSIPESDAKPWEPYKLEPGTIGILSDIHVPYHDKDALASAVKELRRRKISTLILNGDTLDFHSISRYERDPRARDAKGELSRVVELLRWLDQQFPEASKVFKEGNHDERWRSYLWREAPALVGLEHVSLEGTLAILYGKACGSRDGELSESMRPLGWEYIADQRPIFAGRLTIFHGHELPKGMTSPVNPARGVFMRTMDTVLIGHGHRTSQHTEGDWRHSEVACWSTGCLCDKNPDYAKINKWNSGFAAVEVSSDGQFEVSNYRISNGVVRAS